MNTPSYVDVQFRLPPRKPRGRWERERPVQSATETAPRLRRALQWILAAHWRRRSSWL